MTAVQAACEQLRALTPQLLTAARLEFGAVRAFATPRRMGIIVTALAARQRADVQELVGPPKSAAFDANGQPTPACLGFLNKWRARVGDIQIKDAPRGPCIMIRRTLPALTAPRALRALIPTLIGNLQFAKMMRWHQERRASGVHRTSTKSRTTNPEPRTTNTLVFPRPIRWLVALYGSQVVPVRLGSIAAGRITRAHRNQGSFAVRIPAAAQYECLLARHGILIDPAARRAAVERAIAAQLTAGERLAPESVAAGHAGGIPLIDEVAHLVETPAAFRGQCAAKFAALPREILIASMAKYQRVFAVENKQGQLLPVFIAVTNAKPGNVKAVQRVYETILSARLSDSALFYKQDLSEPLETYIPALAGVLVHRQLGSMKDKMERLQPLMAYLVKYPKDTAIRAAHLCKADLVTRVVHEFPSLQGIMGGIYHQHRAPEDDVVTQAIQDHYLTHWKIPRNSIGICLAIADRLDTLTGFFGIGIKPTGSTDPFGLRRAANELIPLGTRESFSLTESLNTAIDGWGKRLQMNRDELRENVRAYLRERLEARAPARYDLVRAVVISDFDSVFDALERIKALERCLREQRTLFVQACKVSQRIRNITRTLKLTETISVDCEKFTEPLERELWSAIEHVRAELKYNIFHLEYVEALVLFAQTFSELLERFFVKVLVNTADASIRTNRMALLLQVEELMNDWGVDLTHVVLESTPASDSSPVKEAVST